MLKKISQSSFLVHIQRQLSGMHVRVAPDILNLSLMVAAWYMAHMKQEQADSVCFYATLPCTSKEVQANPYWVSFRSRKSG